MLVNVVDVALQNGKAKLERYQVAAKTGTAQLTKPGGGYYSDRYFHSFFGFFPASDPKFLVFLYLEDPNVPRYSAETLTAPFLATTKFLLNYYQVPPDR
jgi:cell division protein FtsI/penicillin-binding protein 2